MGMYPSKGALAVGSDADIVLLDPAQARVRAGGCTRPTTRRGKGAKSPAWPSLTMLRGKVMVENGEFKGALTDGSSCRARCRTTIRSRPAV
jgi:dihydropyrimidinase